MSKTRNLDAWAGEKACARAAEKPYRRRQTMTALSISRADYEALTSLDTAEERAAWVRARIPADCDYLDPMPILAGGEWDTTIPIVEEP